MVVRKEGSGGRMYGGIVGGRSGRWSDGGVRVLAIILHRFTPVRDGWKRNEVWDLRVATCACLRLIAFWMYCLCVCTCVRVCTRVCVCVQHADVVQSAVVKHKMSFLSPGCFT